ncbi:hypothetical protein [Lactococcus garvieae]|uniref:hypothetical protein n=1 Tax=Lactococcus garvieae TaxID=1363 RepID=UPI003853B4BA
MRKSLIAMATPLVLFASGLACADQDDVVELESQPASSSKSEHIYSLESEMISSVIVSKEVEDNFELLSNSCTENYHEGTNYIHKTSFGGSCIGLSKTSINTSTNGVEVNGTHIPQHMIEEAVAILHSEVGLVPGGITFVHIPLPRGLSVWNCEWQ